MSFLFECYYKCQKRGNLNTRSNKKEGGYAYLNNTNVYDCFGFFITLKSVWICFAIVQ